MSGEPLALEPAESDSEPVWPVLDLDLRSEALAEAERVERCRELLSRSADRHDDVVRPIATVLRSRTRHRQRRLDIFYAISLYDTAGRRLHAELAAAVLDATQGESKRPDQMLRQLLDAARGSVALSEFLDQHMRAALERIAPAVAAAARLLQGRRDAIVRRHHSASQRIVQLRLLGPNRSIERERPAIRIETIEDAALTASNATVAAILRIGRAAR